MIRVCCTGSASATGIPPARSSACRRRHRSCPRARSPPTAGARRPAGSLRAAYDALPDARKRDLEDKVAIHHYAYSRRNGGYALTNEAEDKRFPPVPQAMIRANPVNGRKVLYVGSHASHIRGMPEEEGRALLKELLDFATQDQFTYLHHWKVG